MELFENLRGKRVLITGASTGIGACTAEIFTRYGAEVGIHYHSRKDKADALAVRLQKYGKSPVLIHGDLLDSESRDNIIPSFIEKTGGIDVLVNNAGAIIGTQHFLDLSPEDWEKTISLNLTAPFFLAKAAFLSMKAHKGGRIINVSSIAAKYGGSASSIHYGAAKAGIEAVTRTLARQGAESNILVNAIQPGVIDTDFHKKIGRGSLTDRVKGIPLGRAGKPIDVAYLCLFLASEAGDYITGQVYGVTGGD